MCLSMRDISTMYNARIAKICTMKYYPDAIDQTRCHLDGRPDAVYPLYTPSAHIINVRGGNELWESC